MNIFRLVHCDRVLLLRRHFSPHLGQKRKIHAFSDSYLLHFPHASDSMFTFTICTKLNCKRETQCDQNIFEVAINVSYQRLLYVKYCETKQFEFLCPFLAPG